MRVRIAVVSAVALLSLACPGPGNTVDGGTGGGSGGGTVGGAGGGSGGGTGGNASVEAYCSGVATRFCDEYIACNRAEASWKTDCEALFRTFFCASIRQSVNAGEQSFDGTKASACLAAIQGAPDCDNFGSVFGNASCQGLTTGLVQNGGQCNDYSDCANSSCSIPQDAGSECHGTCGGGTTGGQGRLGEPCFGTSVSSCFSPYWCDVAANLCKEPKGTGQTCAVSRECNSDNFCNTTTSQCTALPGAGQACNTSQFPYCNSTSYCQFGGTSNQCVAKGGVGATCTSTSQCQTDLNCSGGQCRAKSTEGGPCQGFGDCASGLSCDDVSRTCRTTGYVDAGSQCSSTRYCRDSWCQGAVSNSDGGAGVAGTCNPNYVGQPCSQHYSCDNATYCQGADAGVQGTCQAASIGTPCMQYYTNCRSTDYCNEVTDRCAARSGPGGSCTPGQDESCSSGSVCIATGPDAGVGQCGTPGNAGTTCFVGGLNQCKLPNECINGTCTATGKTGQPCYSSGFCWDGACVGYSADAGVRGNCGPRLADGQPCRDDIECVSTFCDARKGICSSVCQ